ncbi:hypothetical protein GCM10007094_18910 [Pseudovibrio japonicus]|uniref:Uncharacterized protein n=1 Tax=Pseudovibrio japonicus TaxID=366534 RepID=A0ABQ3E9T9_9HYPH|nr:hypothetical protein GCM10007094_18910 [Pseudovibrio japonicus]
MRVADAIGMVGWLFKRLPAGTTRGTLALAGLKSKSVEGKVRAMAKRKRLVLRDNFIAIRL